MHIIHVHSRGDSHKFISLIKFWINVSLMKVKKDREMYQYTTICVRLHIREECTVDNS
jgi:hypothetical protein